MKVSVLPTDGKSKYNIVVSKNEWRRKGSHFCGIPHMHSLEHCQARALGHATCRKPSTCLCRPTALDSPSKPAPGNLGLTTNLTQIQRPCLLNVDFTLRTAPTFIKPRARNTIIITPTIIISPKRAIFVGTRISIRFQLTLISFQTYISGIIIAGVSRDGDRSIEGGGDLLMRSEH